MIRHLLHATDPYDGFEPFDSEVQGWNSEHPKLAELILEIQPKLVVELGSWRGASALWMAKHTDAEIVCVDTWLGSAEMWTDHGDETRYKALKHRNGYPQVYFEFLSNAVKAGKAHQITPCPMPTTQALDLLLHWKIQPDLIYVDASHDFASVVSDIKRSQALWPRILCGDDYHHWDGVKRAVDHMLPTKTVEDSGLWWVDRSKGFNNASME